MIKWSTLAIRVLGVWALLRAFEYTLTGFDLAAGLYRPSYDYTLGGAMVHIFGFFLVGASLLRYAPKIAAYFEAASSRAMADASLTPESGARSPKEIFTIVLRIFGIWALLKTVDYWLEAFDIVTKLYRPTHDTMGSCLTHIIVYFILGLYLLRGAPTVVQLLYRNEKATEQKEHEI